MTTPKGNPVIKVIRQKIDRNIYVSLLPKANQILECTTTIFETTAAKNEFTF